MFLTSYDATSRVVALPECRLAHRALMPDEPFAVIPGVVSIHSNPVAFVSVVFGPDHRMELALPLGAATCSTSPPSTRPFNGATLLLTGWCSWRSTRQEFTAVPYVGHVPRLRVMWSFIRARPQQNVAAIAPASAAVLKQLRFAQHGRALRQPLERALALTSAEPFLPSGNSAGCCNRYIGRLTITVRPAARPAWQRVSP
jgi:hypothetical protein